MASGTHLLFSLVIDTNLNWRVTAGKKVLQSYISTFGSLPQQLTSVEDVLSVVQFLESCHFCKGNEDEQYFPLQVSRKGVFMDSTGIISYPQYNSVLNSLIVLFFSGSKQVAHYCQDFCSFPTIRSTMCQILVSSREERCVKCSEYRKMLNSMLSRHNGNKDIVSERTTADSHTNYRFLRTPEKDERMHQLHRKAKICQQRVNRLKVRLEAAVEQRGILVDSAFHHDLSSTMEENEAIISAKYPPGSFPKIFWEQQHRASKLKDSRSMKWEPAMIRSVLVF